MPRHDKPCPVCGATVGETDGCPCCEQWRNGVDTDGRPFSNGCANPEQEGQQ